MGKYMNAEKNNPNISNEVGERRNTRTLKKIAHNI